MSKEYLVQLAVEQTVEYIVQADTPEGAKAQATAQYQDGDYGEPIAYFVLSADAFEQEED